MRRLLALAVALSACAYYEDRVRDVAVRLAPADERVIHGDSHFSAEERAAFERTLGAWAGFTRGAVRLSVRWDLTDMTYMDLPPPLLYRVWASPETGNMGGRTEGELIWWVPDTCTDLQACAMHEVGHMLGLQHVPYAGHVMSPKNPVHVFGPADFRECVRVGVCRERSPDYTTVTVTVDPSMPNPSLEIPP